MNLSQKKALYTYLGARDRPNDHDITLRKKAEGLMDIFASVRGIRGIFIVNSIAFNATHKGSDIDLFVITSPGMLSSVRVSLTRKLLKLGLWRHGEDIAGNICLSFFIDEESMNLAPIALQNDFYLEEWVRTAIPIFERGNTYKKFLSLNRSWIDDLDTSPKTPFLQHFSTEKLNWYEKFLSGCLFIPLWIKAYLQSWRLGFPSGVIISRKMMKFHTHDRRWEIREALLSPLSNRDDIAPIDRKSIEENFISNGFQKHR